MKPIITNATLTKVEAGSRSPDGRDEGGALTEKWAGASACYVDEVQRVVLTGGDRTRVKETSLVMDPVVDVAGGDYVTFTLADMVEHRRVIDFDETVVGGRKMDVRLVLENE